MDAQPTRSILGRVLVTECVTLVDILRGLLSVVLYIPDGAWAAPASAPVDRSASNAMDRTSYGPQ